MMLLRLLPLFAVLLFLSACGSDVTTQVVPVQTQLPTRETAIYQIQDKDGAAIGQATLSIEPEGDLARVTVDWRFSDAQRDRQSVLLERAGLRPRSSERVVEDEGKQYVTRATYTEDTVEVVFDGPDDTPERTRSAEISETAYDNLESLFLWRATAMGAGNVLNYVNVIVDPKRGNISRALAKLEVSGRELVNLPEGRTIEAWRVDFTSAGVTNSAWYAITDDRRLLKYEIDRGPRLLLESVAP